METAKAFNNVIIGQFVLTGVPVKVYTGGRFLTITDTDDIEDPSMGFGMDENGNMIPFSYPAVEFLSVQGNKVDIETYNKGMEGDKDEEKVEEPKDANKKSDVSEITKDVFNAKMKAIDAEKEALKDKEDALKKMPIDDNVNNYTFGTGDIIKNINPECKHFGSMGVVKKIMNVPMHGKVAVYTVTNNGSTYKPGMSLMKTVDQLEKI
jgi:hypothetical protein